MRAAFAIWIAALAWTAGAEEPTIEPSAADAAIDRANAFLAKDAVAWKTEHQCASCHHASLVVWSMRESKRIGRAVDEPLLAELAKWVADSGDGTTGVPRPEGIPKALNTKAVYYAMALAADPDPDEFAKDGLKRYSATIQKDQLDNGSWASWPETRPPIFGLSDDTVTANAVIALLPRAEAGDESAIAARDKGIKWLAETKSDDDPQSIAMRLLLWKRVGRPEEECNALAEKIRSRQNADGGWRQAEGMESDAWATGQALYALAVSGAAPDDPAIARGREFLVKTQREDGSWAMASRPTKPGGAGSPSVIPITGGGTSWGVIGLARSRGAAAR